MSFGKNDNMLIIPNTANPPRIDGVWSTSTEWTDASETKIVENGMTAYLRAKHDERFVYVLIDFVSDQSLDESGDWAVLCFDTKNGDGKAPLNDDYCFYIATRTNRITSGIMQGNGKGWTGIQDAKLVGQFAKMSYSHFSMYDNTNMHVSSEFKIPLRSYGLEEKMGFYIYLNNGYHNSVLEWPVNAGGK
ncbi:MAG: hypothetical protein ACRD32_05205 [Nitrososphaerales archaeon]